MLTPAEALDITEQAPVTQLPARLLLTAVIVLVTVLAVWGMARNWRKRADRQSWVQLPAGPPPGFKQQSRFSARYVASASTQDWLDRIAAQGLGMPGRAEVLVGADGVLIERTGQTPLFLPAALIEEIGSARGIAQEVYERDGLVVLTWRSGERSVTTGLRMASAQDHTALLDAVGRMIGAGHDSEGKAEV